MPIDPIDPIYALRQQLAEEITRALGGASSQFVIAPSYGIPQPRMSEMSRGIVGRCTMEWLIRRVYRMGGTVEVRVELGDVARAWSVERFRRRRIARELASGGTR